MASKLNARLEKLESRQSPFDRNADLSFALSPIVSTLERLAKDKKSPESHVAKGLMVAIQVNSLTLARMTNQELALIDVLVSDYCNLTVMP